ncbi:MAG: adenylate/guanylate cyclase domain-containing protein [Leptolyngbyaceae cyanobacterium]
MKPSSTHLPVERSLAAIVLTDAVSFSARMSVDEEGTLKLIQRDLSLIADQCECFGGKVLKSTGDGLLMSFYSAVQAVLCSQEVQKQLSSMTEGLCREEFLQHRIGIHLGDVLFSHDDVLGNGVNIAARLQTKSSPGGICISQTVYDVVKARVDINASFLGPLKLKNIQEPVTAYQIPPFGQSATMVVSGNQWGVLTEEQTALEVAAQTLQQDPESRRIKKLVFGTYQGVWENDPRVLAEFDLGTMLKQLRQRHHTLIALEKALQLMASRLNHKEIYFAVADSILAALEPAYDESASEAAPNLISDSLQDHYQEAADKLTQHGDHLRIKKLLYAILHTAWENDPKALALNTMVELVNDVHELAPTEEDLTYHLERIIKRLNRQERYTQLALIISETFHPLYGTTGMPLAAATNVKQLEISESQFTVMGPDSDAMSVANDEGLTSLTGWAQTDPSEDQTCAHDTSDQPSRQLSSESCTIDPTALRDRANLYNLRIEIMRYTNPLRAKILLLSTVRSPFTATRQDWLTLKSKSLDDLLQETFEYCQTFSDLESKLTIMCHCVDNVGDNLQTAGAILQAMKPFYP